MKNYVTIPNAILFCLTLGLAPFSPEPHIWGKIQWIYGGAHGMGWLDWWDTLMHGFPWIVLLVLIVQKGIFYIKNI